MHLTDPLPELLIAVGAVGVALTLFGMRALTSRDRISRSASAALFGAVAIIGLSAGLPGATPSPTAASTALSGSGADQGAGGAGASGSAGSPGSASPGATAPGSVGGPGGAVGGSLAGTTPRPGPGGQSGGVGGGGSGAAALPPISIGFTYDNSQAQVEKELGVTLPNEGSAVTQVNALVGWINSHGGLAGHQIVPDFQQVDGNTYQPSDWTASCKQFTEGHHDFAVVGAAGNQEGPLVCYAQEKTPFLTFDAVEYETSTYTKYGPYIYLPGGLSEDQVMLAEIDGLVRQGFFKGNPHLGLMVQDIPEYHDIVDNVVKPALSQVGFTGKLEVQYVVNSMGAANAGEVVQQIDQTETTFQVQGVTNVMFMYPGGGGWLFFSKAAQSQKHTFIYGFSTADEPHLIETEPGEDASVLSGSVGVGWLPGFDLADSQYAPYPSTPAEKTCNDIMKAAGQGQTNRYNGLQIHAYCDSLFLLYYAAKGLTNLTVDNLTAAIGRLGTSYQQTLPLPNYTRWSPGRPMGPDYYRLAHYDSGCGCFTYNSPTTAYQDPR